MRSFLRRLPGLVTAAALGLAGCDSDSGPGGPSGNTRVLVHLTDAPGDVLEAVVTIDQIYLQGTNGKVVLSDAAQTEDLVQLNNTTQIVADEEVPAGQYDELRFVISGGYVKVETATGSEIFASSPDYAGLPAGATVTGDLQMPSFGSSGLKVKFDGPIDVAGTETAFVVDFDVAQSFGHAAGQGKKWVMHPVVKGAELTAAGSVKATLVLGTGVTLPNIGGNAVTLANFKAKLDGEEVAFTDADANGTFEAVFQNVIPGSYSLTIVGPTGMTVTVTPALPQTVNVAAGAQATVAFTVTAATVP
jgi:Domain of unknown function (DUF4382)